MRPLSLLLALTLAVPAPAAPRWHPVQCRQGQLPSFCAEFGMNDAGCTAIACAPVDQAPWFPEWNSLLAQDIEATDRWLERQAAAYARECLPVPRNAAACMLITEAAGAGMALQAARHLGRGLTQDPVYTLANFTMVGSIYFGLVEADAALRDGGDADLFSQAVLLASVAARLGPARAAARPAGRAAGTAPAAARASRVVDFTEDLGDGLIVRGLRIPEYSGDRAYLLYRRGVGDAGEAQVVIDYVKGVPGVPGVGHELKRALLERFPQAVVHSQLTNVNRRRLLDAFAANRYQRPSLEQLQARVPALQFPGYEYRLTVSGIPADGAVAGGGVIRLEMRPLAGGRSTLVMSDEASGHLSTLAALGD